MRVLILAAALVSMPASLSAHPEGHDDEQFRAPPAPAPQVNIPQAARQAVIRLVSQARLHASWARLQPVSSTERARGGARQWVVSFQNHAMRNPARRRLFVIMRPDGTFVSANYRLT